jgi:hypothetical protein
MQRRKTNEQQVIVKQINVRLDKDVNDFLQESKTRKDKNLSGVVRRLLKIKDWKK